MTSLINVRVESLGRIVTGKTPNTKIASYFDGEFQFVTPSDLGFKHYFCRKTETTVTEEAKEKHINQFIPAGSVMFTCIGNTIGKCAIASEDSLTNQQINSIVPHKNEESKFIYYLLNYYMDVFRGIGLSGGVATPIINKTDFSKVELKAPEKSLWPAIGQLLSIYDDLIENNRRRIQLLEESACLLYQEWFVHLRFPGHEHVKITDGVPEGWTRLTVAECCQKPTYGYTVSATHEAIGPKLLRITDIVPNSISWPDVPYCEADEATTKKYQLNEGDIVVARTGATVGYAKRMPLLSEPVIYASYLVKFSPNKSIVDDIFLGVFMESDQYKDFVRGNAGGAAQPNANAQILGGAKLLVPCELLQNEFRSSVAPLMEQKFLLEKQNVLLAKARDLLLPKLMCGDLTV